jgi:hypothetical protein
VDSSAIPVKSVRCAVDAAADATRSGGADDTAPKQASRRAAVPLALQQFDPGDGALYWSSRPWQFQAVDDRDLIRLNAVGIDTIEIGSLNNYQLSVDAIYQDVLAA